VHVQYNLFMGVLGNVETSKLFYAAVYSSINPFHIWAKYVIVTKTPMYYRGSSLCEGCIMTYVRKFRLRRQ